MDSYTPGPWGDVRHGMHGNDCWTIGNGIPHIAVTKREADARLISAAPELLEALIELRYACTDKAERMADAAIAKATALAPGCGDGVGSV